jgi:hypothetical protein
MNMFGRRIPLWAACLACCLTAGILFGNAGKEKADKDAVKPAGKAVLWTDPGDISTRDLLHGPGGVEHEPHGPFTFDKEDLDGTSPKLSIKDAGGVKWKLKMGVEARPETAATRIVWAVGYSATEDYFLPEIQVQALPPHLHRGQSNVGPNGTIQNARLKREDGKKLGTWEWKNNPFVATREFNGLRALMGVINNWDVKDINNAIYNINDQSVYLVSDLGASFGCPGRCWPTTKAKGDPEEFSQAKFISGTTQQFVSFEAPGRPGWLRLSDPKEYRARVHLEWIGENIPRADAKWLGSLLAKLSPDQLRDAFRAAGYEAQDVDEYARTLTSRIAALNAL